MDPPVKRVNLDSLVKMEPLVKKGLPELQDHWGPLDFQAPLDHLEVLAMLVVQV